MKRYFLVMAFLLSSLVALCQQQRLIVFGASSWFPFDAITGRYVSGSLAQVAGYVDAWREELGEENVTVCAADSFFKKMPDSYKAYLAVSDSTVLMRVLDYFDLKPLDVDRFGISMDLVDSLSRGKIYVVDRWDFFGNVTLEKKVVDVTEFPVSRVYMERLDRSVLSLKSVMSGPLAVMDTVYSTRDCYFGPSVLSGLFHTFQQEVSGSELSLFSPLKFDKTWASGDLYIKDVYDMLTFDNELSVVEARGDLILEFLEDVYGGRYYVMKRPTDDLVRVKTPYFYHESLVGASYWVNVSKPKGRRIENCSIDRTKLYTVSVNSFRAKWFSDRGCSSKDLGEYRLLFLKWLKNNSIGGFKGVEQWRVVPESWVLEAVKREQHSLFRN